MDWLSERVATRDPHAEACKLAAYAYLWLLHIEPSPPERLNRLLRTAVRPLDERLCRQAFEKRHDAVVQVGFAANVAPGSPTTREEQKRDRPKQPPLVNLLMRLRDFQGQVLPFIGNFCIRFDNNQGERDIQMVKVKQKISGGFRTLEGVKRFRQIRGYLSNARKSAQTVFEAIQDAFDGNPFIPSSEMP